MRYAALPKNLGLSIASRTNVMNVCRKITILSWVVFPVLGESTHRYTGHIVNAKCWPAAEIVSRNSRGYEPSGSVNSFLGPKQKPLNMGRIRKAILKRCSLNVGVTEFALVDNRGNFFRLDQPGNLLVFAENIRKSKETTVAIEGSVDRETLKVVSLTKIE